MKARLQAVAVFVVLLLAGALVGSAVSQWGSGGGGGVGVIHGPGGARIRVEVLNGGGHVGAAQTATDRLRERGFDVVYFGNEGSSFDRDSSTVLDRTASVESARAVADALGIRSVRSEPDSNLYLDVSVLLGRDWESLAAALESEEDGKVPWWDPRGWVRR